MAVKGDGMGSRLCEEMTQDGYERGGNSRILPSIPAVFKSLDDLRPRSIERCAVLIRENRVDPS